MKNKWYISVLILALAILGISLKHTSAPNQEIVIQFSDNEITPSTTQKTIAQVKSQLEAVEVDNIKIQELENGILKISYYSDIDVSEIKKIFSEHVDLTLGGTTQKKNRQAPSEKEVQDYQLEVYEIQNNNGLVGSTGIVVDAKSEIIRFFSPDSYATIDVQINEEKNIQALVTHKIYETIAIAIYNAEYKIPLVRAGPTLS